MKKIVEDPGVLPAQFESWNEFHDAVLENLKQDGRDVDHVETTRWGAFHRENNDAETTVTETNYRIRFIEKQVLAELKAEVALSKFSTEECNYILEGLTSIGPHFDEKRKNLFNKILSLLRVERKKEATKTPLIRAIR